MVDRFLEGRNNGTVEKFERQFTLLEGLQMELDQAME